MHPKEIQHRKGLSFVKLQLVKQKIKKKSKTKTKTNKPTQGKKFEIISLKFVKAKKKCLFMGYFCIICSVFLHFIWLNMWERKQDPSLDEIRPA